MIREMTIYELSRAFKESMALFYSASLGSLQVAVRNLLARRLIAVRVVREGKRVKKIYRILPTGTAAFRSSMKSEITPSRLEVTALSRLSFLGLLEEPREKKEVLDVIVETTRAVLSDLEKTKSDLEARSIPPSYHPIFRYQMKTLEYGIMAHRAGLEWFTSVLREIKKE